MNAIEITITRTTILAAIAAVALVGVPADLQGGEGAVSGLHIETAALMGPEHSANKLYFGADAGLALQQDVTVKDTGGAKISFDPGLRLDVAVGYHFTEALAAEFQTGVIYNSIDKYGGVSLSSVGVSSDLYQIPLMANVIYKLPVGRTVTAYLGAGVGGVYSDFYTDVYGYGVGIHTTDFTFGYQGIAGVKYAINDRMDLGIAYKFLGTTDHDLGSGAKSDGTMTHSVLVAFTLKF